MATVITGGAELRRKLSKLKDFKSLVPTLQGAAVHVKGKISKYPSGNQHRPQPFKTAKSRRFFFWALRQGIIEVPYRRGQSPGSEDHGQSWTVKGMKGGLKQVIGSDTSYGRLLQKAGSQTAYHKGTGWKTTDQVMREEEAYVLTQIQKKVDQLLATG
jgi:hypothetical protein